MTAHESGPPSRLVALGAIARPHGVRGEVRVFRYNAESEVLLELEHVWLTRDDTSRRVAVRSSKLHGDIVLMTLDGVVGREAADALRGFEVCAPREALPETEDDEYYHADLVGLEAFDPAGARVGIVSDVIRYPSVDCLVLTGDDGVREVPLLEAYVVEVDLDARRVVVDHLADLDVVPVPAKKR
ncbi:MAG: 16S rRNA processing protein RimM [Sandaracinaceae bacterium]|nr:16S rRNA processing protein RimM [Sandaracinaceae bacterium]